MCVDKGIDSQHMPISCVLSCAKSVKLESEFKPVYIEKLLWMPENMLIFKEKLKEADTIKDIDEAKNTALVGVNQAVDMFTSAMS